jgi:hypothetical protein
MAYPVCSCQMRSKLKVVHLTESSNSPDPLAKPQDYDGLRAELQSLAIDYDPVMAKLWPRLQDHKHRWELHSYGLPNGYGKQVATDIVTLLNGALKSIAVANNKLASASLAADSHRPDNAGSP